MRELDSIVRDEKVFVRRPYVNRTRLDKFSVLSFLDALACLPRQQRGHVAFVGWVKMLNHQDGRKIRLDAVKEAHECAQTAG